jgi:hypothetical protein
MNRQSRLSVGFWGVQLLAVVAIAITLSRSGGVRGAVPSLRKSPPEPVVQVPRQEPLRIAPLYNRPEMVNDADLAAVLRQLRPKFPAQKIKPNFVEHALRIWGVDATFRDPAVMSGAKMRDFLVNHGQYLASWGPEMEPLLQEKEDGVAIRYGKVEGASVHHDHFLACLTEAGVSLNEQVFTPQQHIRTINDVLQRALRDFRVDEPETEWSAMAFGLWISPIREWKLADGRTVTFDMLADRLLRGAKKFGVCSGTHRLYSMMTLVRLDDEFHILSLQSREKIMAHLRNVKQLIMESQFDDGHWPSNWYDGAAAIKTPLNDQLYQQVISTGHHLEWLAIAPEELHPPRAQIDKAARWAIRTTIDQKPESILASYTFYSHIGGALSLWRKTRPADFWRQWEATHPAAGAPEPNVQPAPSKAAAAPPRTTSP